MNAHRTQQMPGYLECFGDGVSQVAPQIIEHDGERFLVVHAPSFTSGVIRPAGTDGEDDRAVLTIWGHRTAGAPIALALSFTPDPQMLDVIIDSLTIMRDRQQATAKRLADAALRKAAGK